MKVNVSGYGMLPFRATECYKFRGEESFVLFRGEVKLPKSARRNGEKKWIQHDYWYDPTQIGVTYGTSPSEADAEKFREAIAAFDASLLDSYFTAACDGKACTKNNCTCKKGSVTPPPTEYDKAITKEFNDAMAYGVKDSADVKVKDFEGTNFRTVYTSEKPSYMTFAEWIESLTEQYDGLTRIRVSDDSGDAGLGSNSTDIKDKDAADESIKGLKGGDFHVINIKEKPADMTWTEFFEHVKSGNIILEPKTGIRQVGTLDDIDKGLYKIYFTADGGKTYYRTVVNKFIVDKDIHSDSFTELVTKKCELDMIALWEDRAKRSEDQLREDFKDAISVEPRYKPEGVSWADFIKSLDSDDDLVEESSTDPIMEKYNFKMKTIEDIRKSMAKLDLNDYEELRHFNTLADLMYKIEKL